MGNLFVPKGDRGDFLNFTRDELGTGWLEYDLPSLLGFKKRKQATETQEEKSQPVGIWWGKVSWKRCWKHKPEILFLQNSFQWLGKTRGNGHNSQEHNKIKRFNSSVRNSFILEGNYKKHIHFASLGQPEVTEMSLSYQTLPDSFRKSATADRKTNKQTTEELLLSSLPRKMLHKDVGKRATEI